MIINTFLVPVGRYRRKMHKVYALNVGEYDNLGSRRAHIWPNCLNLSLIRWNTRTTDPANHTRLANYGTIWWPVKISKEVSKTCVFWDNSPIVVTDRKIRRIQGYLVTSDGRIILLYCFCVTVTSHIWGTGNRLRRGESRVYYWQNYPLTPIGLLSHNHSQLIL